MKLNKLFPKIKTFNEGRLRVSDLHELYYEQSGNPNGKPIVYLHGGPGGRTNPLHRRFFDPKFYRIILFDQRGTGKSTPHAEIRENTAQDSVLDLEKLRKHLGLNNWMLFGGSWGATLALLYASSYPSRVKGLILRAICLWRAKEVDWFFEQGGAHMFFPEEWERYLEQIPGVKPGNMVEAYYQLLTSDDESVRLKAALSWSRLEAVASRLRSKGGLNDKSINAHIALPLARLECHFCNDKIFMQSNDSVLKKIKGRLKGIPIRIIEGRYDVVCPIGTAWELKNVLGLSDEEFRVVIAGHSYLEPEIKSELVQATQDFKKHFK